MFEKFFKKSINHNNEEKDNIIEDNIEADFEHNLNTETSANEESLTEIDTDIYNSLKICIETSIKNGKCLNTVSLNMILINLVFKFGYYEIMQSSYLDEITTIIMEQDIQLEDINIENLKRILTDILYMENIQYWDSDEQKIYDCCAIFNGKYIGIRYNNLQLDTSIIEKGLIHVNSHKLESFNEYSVFIDNTSVILNVTNKDILLSYYQKINDNIEHQMKVDKIFISEQVENVPENIIQIILNYIENFPQNILLNRDNYIEFEHLISFSNYYTKFSVEVDEEQRNQAIERLSSDQNSFNQLKSLRDENYNKLVKIVGKYLDVDDEINSSITWSLIKKFAPKYFTEVWTKNYGSYFENIFDKSIDDLVCDYCYIDEINAKNINTIGIFTYYLINNNKFPNVSNNGFLECNALIINYVLEECEKIELKSFEAKLTKSNNHKSKYTINDIDMMNGHEFECFIAELFSRMGYRTEITKGSGDQGIDVLIEKNGVKIGIQAKCYSGNVTNKAVQETVAGVKYYSCEKGIVVTNSFYTSSALELAEANNIMLWDRNMLKQKLDDIFN